jgi:hypothetical protein
MSDLIVPSNISPEQRESYRSRNTVTRSNSVDIPTIKLKNSMSKVKGVKKGHFFTTEEIDGEVKHTDLGETVEVVILNRYYTYSNYDKDTEKLVAWTNEIIDFDSNVCVYVPQEGSAPTTEIMHFTDFKTLKKNDKWGRMTFKNVLYVLLNEKVYRMFISNASNTGVVDGDKYGDFDNPLPDSLMKFCDKVGAQAGCFTDKICILGANWLEDNNYYTISFNVGDTPKVDAEAYAISLEKFHTATHNAVLPTRESGTVSDAVEVLGATPAENTVPIPEVTTPTSKVKASDLPF